LLRYFGVLKSRANQIDGPQDEKSTGRFLPFSFKITREGFLYICGVFLLSLAAVNSGNNLLFIVVAALLSAIAVSGIISRSSLRQISLSLQLPENVFVGERISIKITLRNLKRIFPSFSILVEDPDFCRKRLPLSLSRMLKFLRRNNRPEPGVQNRAMLRQAAYFPMLRAGETRSELAFQSFPHRGLYHLRGFWISTQFPFGLFRRGEFIAGKGEILVYPLIQETSSFFRLLPFLPGHLEGSHMGHGENLFSIRKYQESESARIIDWKATAKTGELMAREYAREEEKRICLILDTQIHNQSNGNSGNKFEKAVSLAASITAYFLREGAEMEFLTPYEHVPRGIGLDHLYRILRSMAVVQYETASSEPSFDPWAQNAFPCIRDTHALQQIFSDKVFKIIISSKPRGSFPSTIWRSSHVVFFDEL
jgi:uncharacterized protein (DUF58 family)